MTSDDQFFPVTDYIKWKPFVVRDDPPKKVQGRWLKVTVTAFPPKKLRRCQHAEIIIPPHP